MINTTITLRNQEKLDEIRGNLAKPKTLDELLSHKKMQKSLEDNGIDRFKEIKDFNHISFGHFILLEKILALDKLTIEQRIAMASPIILRPLDELKLDNEDVKKEAAHKEMVLNEPIGNIYGSFHRFMDLRAEYLYKTYNGVIYATIDEDDEDDEEEEEGTNISSGTSAREFHSKKFFWNSMISDVANGDIFKFNEVVELMMYTVMPYLAERRSLSIVENLEHKASLR